MEALKITNEFRDYPTWKELETYEQRHILENLKDRNIGEWVLIKY